MDGFAGFPREAGFDHILAMEDLARSFSGFEQEGVGEFDDGAAVVGQGIA